VTRLQGRLAQDPALSIQCVCTGLVALGAAYASYRHGREIALRFGADGVTASIWPLLVDGPLTIATVELWKTHRAGRRSGSVGGVASVRVRYLSVVGGEHLLGTVLRRKPSRTPQSPRVGGSRSDHPGRRWR
jgi:hypothetical protein